MKKDNHFTFGKVGDYFFHEICRDILEKNLIERFLCYCVERVTYISLLLFQRNFHICKKS